MNRPKKNISIKKLLKSTENIKVVHNIILLFSVSVIVIAIISGTGFYTMKRANQAIDEIYNKNLMPIIEIGEMKNNFYILRYCVSMASESKFYYEYEKDMKSSSEAINEGLQKYESSYIDTNQKEYIDRIKSDYNSYLDIWESIKTAAKNNTKLSAAEITKKKTLESNIINYFNGLIKYNNLNAEGISKSSEELFKSNIGLFSIIVFIAILFLSLLTITIVRTINKSIKEIIKHLSAVSEGDFTERITIVNNNDFSLMKLSLNEMMKRISYMLKLVKENCDYVACKYRNLSDISKGMNVTSAEVTSAIQEVSAGSLVQSENLSLIDGSINELGNELSSVLDFMEEVRENTKITGSRADEGNAGLEQLKNIIQGVDASFKEVSQKIFILSKKVNEVNNITGMINTIADQTNLLALNASIEASRAGEAGRGFSVVANEVRNLSEQAKSASQNIQVLLKSISTETTSVVATANIASTNLNNQLSDMNETILSFKKIIEAIGHMLPRINNASQLVFELNEKKNYVIAKIRDTSLVSQENAALSQQISSSSQEMHNASEDVAATILQLDEMINSMRLQVEKFRL